MHCNNCYFFNFPDALASDPMRVVDYMDKLVHCSISLEFGWLGKTNMEVSTKKFRIANN